MLQGLRLGNALRPCANDHAQFHLPVGLGGYGWNEQRVVRAAECGHRFHEQHGLGGRLQAGLQGLVAVVQAHAHDLAPARHGARQAHRLLHRRQAGGVDGSQGRQGARRQLRWPDVGQQHGKVAQDALGIQHAGALGAGQAVTDQSHGSTLEFVANGPNRKHSPASTAARFLGHFAILLIAISAYE